MNIYQYELKSLLKSILLWGSGISFGFIFYMMFFPLMMVENDAMTEIMRNFPEEFLAFFGMSAELSFTTIMGYFGLTMSFIYIPIAIQAALYGVSTLSVEEREMTADFLLAKPVSRKEIFLAKTLSSFTALLIVDVLLIASSYLSLFLFNAGNEVRYLEASLVLIPLPFIQLFFLSTGLLLSMVVKKVPSVISFAMGLGFGGFVIGSFAKMLSIDSLKYVTPYTQFDPIDIIVDKGYNIQYFSVCIFVILIASFTSYLLYERRNIKAL